MNVLTKLTEKQRKKIYEEEKQKLEGRKKNGFLSLLVGNVIVALFLSLLVKLSKHKFPINIKSVRKAHEGIDYQEEEK